MTAQKENQVLSFCGKCKEPTMHEILEMVDEDIIGKCICSICKAKHLYRDPVTKKSPKKGKSKAPAPEKVWKQALDEAEGDSKKYSMKAGFESGQIIEHKTFGKGVIEEVINDKKIKVVFEQGLKILVHNQ